MKLKYFSQQTMPKQLGAGRAPARVSFNKSGTINFNQSACDLMGIKSSDKLSFAQDEENEKDWYWFIDKDNGYEVRSGYDKKGVLFNHATLIKNFNEQMGFDQDVTANYLLAQTPTTISGSKTKYWCLLIKE